MNRSRDRGEQVQFNIVLDKALLDRLRAEAKRREVSAAYLGRRCLERQLDHFEGQDLP